MKTKIIATITTVLVLGFAGVAEATIVDVCTATNKPVYALGEEVVVFVIAYNPNPDPVTLNFPDCLQRSYLMDGVYDWTEGKGWCLVPSSIKIPAYDSYTWNLKHGLKELEYYPLVVGTHTVIGYVVGYGQSAPVEFEVIPEPSTILLIVIGFVAVRVRNQKLSLQQG